MVGVVCIDRSSRQAIVAQLFVNCHTLLQINYMGPRPACIWSKLLKPANTTKSHRPFVHVAWPYLHFPYFPRLILAYNFVTS